MNASLPVSRKQGRARYVQAVRRALEHEPTAPHGSIAHRDGSRIPLLKLNGEDLLPAQLAPDAWFRTRHATRRPDIEPGRQGVLKTLAASTLAGTAPHTRRPQWLREALHDPVKAPGAFALREDVGLRSASRRAQA